MHNVKSLKMTKIKTKNYLTFFLEIKNYLTFKHICIHIYIYMYIYIETYGGENLINQTVEQLISLFSMFS